MSVEVRPATADDIDSVVDLLYDNMSQKIPKARWRNILDYPWRPDDADRGCVAMDGDRAVGFLGLVYADRPIGGRTTRFCNICAWYLLKAYRGQGIGQRIQFAAAADPQTTYTIMTATLATGRAFSENSGFRVLDDSRYLLRRRAGSGGDLDVIDDPNTIESRLSPDDRRRLQDHRPYNLRHLLASAGDASCYIAMQVKRKGDDIDYHEVMYASDPAFIVRHGQKLADTILTADRSVLAVDKRFVPPGQVWESETIRLPRWYRSPSVPPALIDHLYGEVALLDLKLRRYDPRCLAGGGKIGPMLARMNDAARPEIDPILFRRVMSRFATGVTVITAEHDGEERGMTANAFMSGSLEPPLCVVSIAKRAHMHHVMIAARHFGVNILAESQVGLSEHFAGRPNPKLAVRFARIGPAVVLASACARIAVETVAHHDCGDHTIFIGHILGLHAEDGPPLLYHAGRYHGLGGGRLDTNVGVPEFW